jgi:hypothetical protein
MHKLRNDCISENVFIVLCFRKKWSEPVYLILQKYYSLKDTKVLILQFLVIAKHIKIFETVVFLKTVVLLKYFKRTLLPNAA